MSVEKLVNFEGNSLSIRLPSGAVWLARGRDLKNVAAVHVAHGTFGNVGACRFWADLGLPSFPDDHLIRVLEALDSDVPDDIWGAILAPASETEA